MFAISSEGGVKIKKSLFDTELYFETYCFKSRAIFCQNNVSAKLPHNFSTKRYLIFRVIEDWTNPGL